MRVKLLWLSIALKHGTVPKQRYWLPGMTTNRILSVSCMSCFSLLGDWKVMFHFGEEWDCFENTGISLLGRIIGSYLAGIYNTHLGGTSANEYEDYCVSERGCVYAFRTAKVLKWFFIANFSKSWAFFEIEIPVNFRAQLIQAPSNFK